MTKIKKISVSNLKAVSSQTADFNGCTAIITGGNNKGKTSFLRSLFDRCRGVKPDEVLKHGEKEGFAEAELTTGEKIRWDFKEGGKEKLTYITDKDIKTSLTSALREKYLPNVFDVDKFLSDQPAKQKKQLQELVGIDFTDIDARYKIAYQDRESKNRTAKEEEIKLQSLGLVNEVKEVSLEELNAKKEAERERLNKLYLENKKHNEALRIEHNDKLKQNQSNKEAVEKVESAIEILNSFSIDCSSLNEQIDILRTKVVEIKEPEYIEEMPDSSTLAEIDKEILSAVEVNQKAADYKSYIHQKEKTSKVKNDAIEADKLVQQIEKERMDLIKSSKMPEGFGFTEDGITYNNLPFTREQLSSSAIYIAALKLASMTLGEIKTLHFDASFLDKNSLSDIEKWATENDLQLLIERPDFEGGEIEYQLISHE